jgi:O-antigen/teichoic acid export membrane protein
MAARVLEVLALLKASQWRPRLTPPWKHPASTRALLTFGLHVSVTNLLWFLYSNSDFAIIGKLAGPVALGYYALAFQLISLPVQKLTANANQVAYPVYCRLQDDRPRLRTWYLRLTVLLGFLGMPALAGMALVAEDAFALVLGERWLPAVLPFQLLSVVGILMVYATSLPPLFNALGRPDINVRYTVACTLLYPAAFYAGGTWGGLVGICLAWLLLYPVVITCLVVLTRRLTGVGVVDLVGAQVPLVGAVLVMTGVVLAVRGGMAGTPWPWLRLLVSIVAGAAAYAGVLLALGRRTVLAEVAGIVRELRGGK